MRVNTLYFSGAAPCGVAIFSRHLSEALFRLGCDSLTANLRAEQRIGPRLFPFCTRAWPFGFKICGSGVGDLSAWERAIHCGTSLYSRAGLPSAEGSK
jgi:hypothetical protein